MNIKNKLREVYLQRGRELFQRHMEYPEDDQLERIFSDFEAAGADEEIDFMGRIYENRGDLNISIKCYKRSGNIETLINLGTELFERAISSECSGNSVLGNYNLDMGGLFLAIDAFEAAGTYERLEEVADFALELGNYDLAVDALEKGGFNGRLAVLGDEALVKGEYEQALELYQKAGASEIVSEMGNLFLIEGDYEKAGKVLRETGKKHSLFELYECLCKKGDLSPIEYGLFFDISGLIGKKVPDNHKERLFEIAISEQDQVYMDCAINHLTNTKKLEKLGDACFSREWYDGAAKAYEKAEKIRRVFLKKK